MKSVLVDVTPNLGANQKWRIDPTGAFLDKGYTSLSEGERLFIALMSENEKLFWWKNRNGIWTLVTRLKNGHLGDSTFELLSSAFFYYNCDREFFELYRALF